MRIDMVPYHGTKIITTYHHSSYTGTTWDNGDIVGVALDLDNLAVYFSLNGTWQNSGDPTSGSSKTGGIILLHPIIQHQMVLIKLEMVQVRC